MQKVPTKKQLQQKINEEKIPNKTLFFSLAKKQRNLTGSLFRKDIILIFCPEDNTLFYVNQDHKLPFVDEANLQKAQIKDKAEVSKSTFVAVPDSTQILITYPKKDQKGKETSLEWRLGLANKAMVTAWVQMLTRYKEEVLKSPIKASGIKPIPNPIGGNNLANPAPNTNASNVNASQVKKAEEPQKQNHINLLLTDSRIMLGKQEELNPDISSFIINNPNSKPSPNPTVAPVQPSNPTKPAPNTGTSVVKPQVSPIPPTNNPSQSYLTPQDILRYQSKPLTEEQSRLSYAYEMTSRVIGPQDSRIKPQNENTLVNDWNFKFIKNPTRQTVLEFERAAVKAFEAVYTNNKDNYEGFVEAQVGEFFIQIADNFTEESKRLKKQYRNYHYIIESCKAEGMINVPLACLIEFMGSVSLVKAAFPKDAVKIKNKKQVEPIIGELQNRTRIQSSILFYGSCDMYDLTKQYGSYGEASRIYLDNLDQYMPQFSIKKKEQDQANSFYLRPQLLQDLGNRIIAGGSIDDQKNTKIKAEFSGILESEIRDIAECLSSEDIYITSIFDLKQFLHYRGVNMKFLYQIYTETKNKFVKRYLLTCIVAKLIKDQINYGLSIVARESKTTKPEEYVEEQIRLFVEGKTAATNECWKKLSIQFRSIYGTSINTHEIIGGFLLSCILTLIPAEYKNQLIDKQKVIFKDQGIIERGFVHRLKPKVKSYYRFSPRILETVQICKYSQQNQDIYKRLVGYMGLKDRPIPQSYNVNNGRPYILGYLSDFVPPAGMGQDTLPCAEEIYKFVNFQPPNTPTLKITLNYIKQWLIYLKGQKNKADQKFEELIRESVDIVNFWLQFQHPKICDFYEKVSFYEDICGDTQESLNILQKAIEIAYKTEAKNNKKIGMRHYVTGCQYLKAGRKKQAIDNLQKAKTFMQKSEGEENQYALVLLKLSSLQLNGGDTDSCIKLAKQALKNAQKGGMNDTYAIKICQILCRAYEIKGQKEQLRKLSANCAKDFNKTPEKAAFGEMVKICLTGAIAKLTLQKSKSLLGLTSRLKQQKSIKDQNQSLAGLMQKSKFSVVMEVFLSKSQNVQRYLNDLNHKKPTSNDCQEFMTILGLVAGCVGIDFIEGLHAQKQFE